MKSIIKLCSLFLVLVSCKAVREKSAQIATSSKSINLDTIKMGAKKEVSYTLFNTGTDTLVIEGHTCSCECTTSTLTSNQKIAPSDSLNINFLIATSVRDAGQQKKVLCTFKSNTKPAFTYVEINYMVKGE